jgi:hypothetical protein
MDELNKEVEGIKRDEVSRTLGNEGKEETKK